MGELAIIFLGACLVNNLALDAMLGLPPAIAVAKRIAVAVDLALAMLIALISATLVTWLVHHYLLLPLGLTGLEIFVFILVITLAIKTVEHLLRRYRPALHARIAVFVPLILIDSAVLGAVLINLRTAHGLLESLCFALGTAVGFGLVCITLAAMHDRLLAAEIPAPFRGLPVTLITLGLMSMAFMGFNGIAGR